ncbi:MAG: SDR family NAD(P)-dependent oxidoreductase [Pseudomonadota bacterium]
MNSLEGKICLVAGASSGMGRETARHLAAAGGHVICAARRQTACDELAAEICEAGGAAEALKFDGTDEASVNALLAEVGERHGRLHGLFNNLGDTLGASSIEETPTERWSQTLAVNLTSVFYLTRAAVPLLRAAKGASVVNNSSTAGLKGIASMADYCAAKWGVIGLTRTAAVELASANIRVNVVAPGVIETEKFSEFEQRSPELFEQLRDETPLGRFGDMAEIGQLVTFLLSDASSYLTGATIPVDGGRTA